MLATPIDEKASPLATSRPTAIVIGCGVGGIATAARLTKAGFDVTIYEKNAYSGGRCSLIEKDGFRFDRGPSLLLLPDLFRQAFEDLGEKMEDWVDLIKCEPNYIVHFHDDEQIELSTDLSRMKKEIERFEGKDGFERFLGFLAESHRHYELSVLHVLSKDFPSIFSLLRWTFLKEVLRLHPLESIWSRVSRFFETERLRRAFSFSSMYMGMSPFEAPGTYSLLQYTELTEGIWYPKGGFWQVPNALLKIFLASNSASAVHLSTPVSQILLSPDNKKATGVRLENGKEHLADVVVVNADLMYAQQHLLPPAVAGVKRLKALEIAGGKMRGSCSSISFYWQMSEKIVGLNAHNVFLAEDYKGSFDAIFQDLKLPKEPSFYINVPSRIDPTAAPEGKDAVVILVPCGHIDPDAPQDWPALVSHAREFILKTLSAKLKLDLRSLIEKETVNDAVDWEREFNLQDGSILGLGHNFTQVLGFRPSIKHPSISSLFAVGASTHPGTGVPIVLAGSKLTTDSILRSFDLPLPPPLPSALSSLSVPYYASGGKPRTGRKHAGPGGLDERHTRAVMDLERWVYLGVLMLVVWLARVGWVMMMMEGDGGVGGLGRVVGGDW